MAIVGAQLLARIVVEGAQAAKADIAEVGEQTKKTQSIFKGAFSMAAGQVLFAGLGFLKDQIGDVISSAINQQGVMSQTMQTLKSMGNASGQTAQSIGNFADKMTTLTNFSDDAIQSGENMLLTFGNIGKSVFPQASKSVLDFAQFMKMDLSQAALQVGKALNDPVAGMGNLQREGVKLSPALQQNVKDLVAHGKITQAQKIILNELSREFGGSAEAAGKTFGGQLQIAQNKLGLVKEEIGAKVLPILAQLATYVTSTIIPAFEKFAGNISTLVNWFSKHQAAATALKVGLVVFAGAVIAAVVPAFIAWAGAAGAAAVATIAATWPILAIGAAVGLVVAGIVLAVQHWGAITQWLGGVWHTVIGAMGSFFSGVGSRIHDVISGIGGAFSALGSLVRGVWDGIVGAIRGAINWVIGMINSFIAGIDAIHVDIGPVHVGAHIAQIPKLATGGFIESTGLALVHRGEMVVPPARVSSSGSAGGGQPVIIQLHLNGRMMTSQLLPDFIQAIREGTGVYGL